MKPIPDRPQRQRAIDPYHSFIVQAPAGSGKTELLTQRMLNLLAIVEQPEEVVAITFTRKAAAEMSHRLVTRLREAAAESGTADLPEHERISRDLALAVLDNDSKRGWNLLSQPGRIRIRTIDSLCSELASQLPIVSGLGGGQQVVPDPRVLYREAAVRTFASIEDADDPLQQDVIALLDRYDNRYDALVDLVTGMLANRDQWLEHLLQARYDGGFDRGSLEESLRILIEAQLQVAHRLTPASYFEALPEILDYALGNEPDDADALANMMQSCLVDRAARLHLPPTADNLDHWRTLIQRFLTKGGKDWRKTVSKAAGFPAPSQAKGEERSIRDYWKQAFTGLLERSRENPELFEAYRMVLKLPDPAYEDEAWSALESMMRVLLRAASQWQVVMAETGKADFPEITVCAIQALGSSDSPSDLALRMDYRISHLLVDEFQDTSHAQVTLLDRLTAGWSPNDGRSLFLVGDPMQSIYRFRKAEVSLFIQAWSGELFPHIGLIPLQLQVNFRSNPPIVDWTNRVFEEVMPGQQDPVMGAVTYSPASARPGADNYGGVHINCLPERDDREEALGIIDVIRNSQPGETIAILVRVRSHAAEIMALLDQERQKDDRFRYQAREFNRLSSTPLIQDLVSLTLALIQPADRLAWLSVLRAPFVGLDLADLDHLVNQTRAETLIDSIGLMAASVSEQSPAGIRLQRVAPILQKAVDQRGRRTVRSLVEDTWIRLGGPACLDNRSQLADARTYFNLVEELESTDYPIDHDTLEQSMSDLYAEPDADAPGHLQIMTVYSAKGLQFDRVIVPGLNRRPKSDDRKLLHWFELADEDRMVLGLMRNHADKEMQQSRSDLLAFISDVEKQRKSLEDARLMYVAATRAISNLHLFGSIKPNSKGEVKPDAGSLMACLWPAIGNDQAPRILEAASELAERADAQPDQQDSGYWLPQVVRRLPLEWACPNPPDPIQPVAPAEVETRDYIEFSWAGEGARLTGDLVHQLLMVIARDGIDAWLNHGGMASREDWCRRQLAAEGVTGKNAEAIIERTARAVRNSIDSEHGRWILQDHDQGDSEFALTAVIDGQPTAMVLDRTFVDGGVRWIIDYKTSDHAGGNLAGFLASERDRYRDQLLRYRTAMSFNEALPIRTALYFPLLDEFCEVE